MSGEVRTRSRGDDIEKRALQVAPRSSALRVVVRGGWTETPPASGVWVQSVAHGLGRKPVGWAVTDIVGPAWVWRADTDGQWDDRMIKLALSPASADYWLDIEVW